MRVTTLSDVPWAARSLHKANGMFLERLVLKFFPPTHPGLCSFSLVLILGAIAKVAIVGARLRPRCLAFRAVSRDLLCWGFWSELLSVFPSGYSSYVWLHY